LWGSSTVCSKVITLQVTTAQETKISDDLRALWIYDMEAYVRIKNK